MNETIFLGKIGRVPLRLHVSLILLAIIWIAVDLLNKDISATLAGAILLVLIFVSILLHELGHALAARCFGIRTSDIVLHFFGGEARLEDRPQTPIAEIAISLAGPAVNLGLAAPLYGVALLVSEGRFPIGALSLAGICASLSVANLVLGLFNLLPGYPLDGGQVTRALLSLRLSRARSRLIVARIGQVIGIFIGVFGLAVSPLSLPIGIVLFFSAKVEAATAKSALARNRTPPGASSIARR